MSANSLLQKVRCVDIYWYDTMTGPERTELQIVTFDLDCDLLMICCWKYTYKCHNVVAKEGNYKSIDLDFDLLS